MKDLCKATLRSRWLLPVLSVGPLLMPAVAVAQTPAPTKYVVLQVSNSKVFHKAVADKDQETFKKSQEEEYQKAKRSLQDEKKEFQKKHPGEKFDKPEPKKPVVKVVKRDIKSYNEAMKIATDLDRELEKGKKNGKGSGKGDSGKSDTGKGDSGKGGEGGK